MTKKRRFVKTEESPRDPLFVSRCHPESTVNYMEIVEDSMPKSKIIAIVGKCNACNGVQRVYKYAENIDHVKLAKHVHGTDRWLLQEDTVITLRRDKERSHGNINGTPLPRPARASAPMPTPDKDHTESNDRSPEEGVF